MDWTRAGAIFTVRECLVQHEVQNIQDDFVVLIMMNIILSSAVEKYSECAGTSSSSSNYLCRSLAIVYRG